MATLSASIPSRPHRSARSRQDYREPDSDSDLDVKAKPGPSRPTRASKRIRTYKEESDSANDSPSLSEAEDEVQPRTEVSVDIPVRPRTRADRRKHHHSTIAFKRRKLSHIKHIPSKVHNEDVEKSLVVNADAPQWQSLEFEILRKIFTYAAHPLYENAYRTTASVAWLLGVSKLCKNFHEAAISALMWSPPLVPSYRAHGLIALLGHDQSKLLTNYRTKIHALEIEVKQLLISKSGFNLEDLLQHTPVLSKLRIFHAHDHIVGKTIWAQPAASRDKWSYTDLFLLLNRYNIRLTSFEWNGRFSDANQIICFSHTHSCMKSIREITLVNFECSEKQEAEFRVRGSRMVEALRKLPDLQALHFKNCNVLNAEAMSWLPDNLTTLSIINCLNATSQGLEQYLSHGGASIKQLTLAGNQVMDLGFCSDLQNLSPRLEHLEIDLAYDDWSSFNDREPLYDELLPKGCPTWPKSLQSIVIGPLRSLSMQDAEAFYTSLIMSATEFEHLKVLVIKTILKAGWRDRARLRSKWTSLFKKVFLAPRMSPVDFPTSRLIVSKSRPSKMNPSSRRKSVRLQEQIDESTANNSEDEQQQIASLLPDLVGPLPLQKRCTKVEFDLSDQRPAQDQFREEDFLDDELSGDEEWNGHDDAS